MSGPLLRRVACLLLAGLVCLAAVDAAEASLRIVLRFAVLSFDSPATQYFDELVCETSPPSQAGREADQSTRLGPRPSGRLVLDALSDRPPGPALSSGITRSPPVA